MQRIMVEHVLGEDNEGYMYFRPFDTRIESRHFHNCIIDAESELGQRIVRVLNNHENEMQTQGFLVLKAGDADDREWPLMQELAQQLGTEHFLVG